MALPDAERRAMGRRGREWMARAFAWPAIAQRMAEVYEWLARGRQRPDCVHID
jgi:glycosyltransferase involved in cell wall biosynthesis